MADESVKPTQSESELEQIAEQLTRHSVEFLVIGGQAEILMGSPRITYDIDICYRRTGENLNRLANALQELKPTLRGAPPDLPIVLEAPALALGNNYTFNTRFGPASLAGSSPMGHTRRCCRGAKVTQSAI
ncbi:MAG TPA: hypothetical protein VHE81_10060 [Lacipirellulaceae bacterium]|nr:hypothetical protein [Lacipirellulaceae bacterium]